MDYTVVSSSQWTYPDISDYPGASGAAALDSARRSYASAQILLFGLAGKTGLSIRATGELASFECEWYELVPVYVEDNPGLKPENAAPGIPSRKAPFYLYDCMRPFTGEVTPKDGTAGLYFALVIPAGAKPGVYSGSFEITAGNKGESVAVPVELTVYRAVIPEEENLKIIMGYNPGKTAEYHKATPGSPEHKALDLAYMKLLRRMRQNMLYASGASISGDGEQGYTFDFSRLLDFVEKADALGFKYYNMSSVGGRRSWKESTILVRGMPAMSYEAYVFLSQYLPALVKALRERNLLDRFYMGVADEPNDANATEFRALCGLVRKLAPEIRLIDALSYTAVHGSLDVWVPLNAQYHEHMKEFESFRGPGDEIWHYVCCGPRGNGYINRLMDYPLLSTRYLYWGNYKYNLGGYLHWATNCYQPGQDPFTLNCPRHTNADSTCTLPPGDSHIIYPGEDGPWMSIRLEAHRASAEDYELLLALSKKDKPAADALCERCFKSFKEVDYDVAGFEAARRELLERASDI